MMSYEHEGQTQDKKDPPTLTNIAARAMPLKLMDEQHCLESSSFPTATASASKNQHFSYAGGKFNSLSSQAHHGANGVGSLSAFEYDAVKTLVETAQHGINTYNSSSDFASLPANHVEKVGGRVLLGSSNVRLASTDTSRESNEFSLQRTYHGVAPALKPRPKAVLRNASKKKSRAIPMGVFKTISAEDKADFSITDYTTHMPKCYGSAIGESRASAGKNFAASDSDQDCLSDDEDLEVVEANQSGFSAWQAQAESNTKVDENFCHTHPHSSGIGGPGLENEKIIYGGHGIHQIEISTGRCAMVHHSISAASKSVGFCRQTVSAILNGTYSARSKNGWTFQYGSNQSTIIDEELQENAHTNKEYSCPGRKGYCVQQIEAATGACIATFVSYSMAERKTGISRQKISGLVNGTADISSYKGWTFRRISASGNETQSDGNLTVNTDQGKGFMCDIGGKKSGVQLHDTGVTAFVGLRNKEVQKKSSREKRKRDLADFGENLSKNANTVRSVSKRYGGQETAIAVDEIDAVSGKVLGTYRSLSKASLGSGVSRRDISKVLQGRLASVKGKKWRYQGGTNRTVAVAVAVKSTSNRGKEHRIRTIVASKKNDRIKNQVSPFSPSGRPRWRRGHPYEYPSPKASISPTSFGCLKPVDCHRNVVHAPEPNPVKSRKVSPTFSCEGGEEGMGFALLQNTGLPNDNQRYGLKQISFSKKGSIGLGIEKHKLPSSLLSQLQQLYGVDGSRYLGVFGVLVTSLKLHSLGGSKGICVGDWLVVVEQQDTSRSALLLQYETVRDAVREGCRPITLAVVRTSHGQGHQYGTWKETVPGTPISTAQYAQSEW